TKTKSMFFTDGRYAVQARAEVEGSRVIIARRTALTVAAQRLTHNRKSLGGKRPWKIGIEGEHLTVQARNRLAGILSSDFRIREAPPLVEGARMVKDAEEIELIRAAMGLGASLFDRVLEVIRPEVREADVAAEIEYTARTAGAQEMSFPTIIAAGE